jgi:ribosomal protein S18 acetylase RimI-like enzyme
MQAALDWLIRKGILLVTLGVTGTNATAQSFYKKLGFKDIGSTIAVPDVPGKTITVMGKRL